MSEFQMPIVVAGSGVIGTCIACELQRRGLEVVLLDRDAPGAGCSAGNAGVIASEAVLPLASTSVLLSLPSMLLRREAPLRLAPAHLPRFLPWMLRFLAAARPARQATSTRVLAALLSEAVPAWKNLLEWARAGSRLQSGGWLFAYSDPREFARGSAERALQDRHGIRWRLLEAATRAELAPGLTREISHVVHYPDAAWVTEPRELVGALAQRFERDGGRLLRGELQSVRVGDDGQHHLTVDGQPLSASTLVLCLGAHSGSWVERLEGFQPPLQAERGYHLQFDAACPGLRLPVMFTRHKIVATPMRHGLRLAGTAEFAGLNAPPDERRALGFREQIGRLLDLPTGAATATWSGLRPTLPDSLPVIGRSTRHAGLYYAFGHQHLGLTLAAVGARRLAALVAPREGEEAVAELDLGRFRRG